MRQRFLMVCPFYPPHVGGVERYAADLHQALITKEAVEKIIVLAPALPKSAPSKEESDRITILRYPAIQLVENFPFPAIWQKGFQEALKSVRENSPTVTFSHTRFFISSLIAWRLARQLKIKWIHIEHGSSFVQTGSTLVQSTAWCYDQLIGKQVLRSADGLIAISQAVADFIYQFSGRKAEVIYRGMDIKFIQQAKPDPSWRKKIKNNIIICFVGRLISGKGIKEMIDSAKLLSKQPISWLIVGDGPEGPEFQATIKKNHLDKKFLFTGTLPPDKVSSVIKATDIFINPSYSEGLPTTVLEAALCGQAIIATDVGGTREIIAQDNTGYLIKPHNTNQLVSAIKKLANNKSLRQQLGKKAQQSAMSRFNWQECIEQLLCYTEKIIQGDAN